ncbi:hypothetical protein FRC12_004934 [Ceratobasidium sp. 428]|nr:hypothetical protein FRC12_004934 [Ceratobasidium sp. 428]
MKKTGTSPKCRFCGWIGKSYPAVERHISHKPECKAKRTRERDEAPPRPPRFRTQVDFTGLGLGFDQYFEPNPPASPPRSRSPSVTLEEVDDEDLLRKRNSSPRRNPNAILEDIEDEDAPDLMPPRRSPSVTIEDVEDEDMPGNFCNPPRQNPNAILEEVEDEDLPPVPQWGPHPFAKPTRPSLFPVPHPNPTAGAALEFHEVNREPPPKYTSVLAEPDVFQEAYWLDHLPISRVDEAEYFSLPRTNNWHWGNLKEFKQEVNRLPRGPSWFRETIRVVGDQNDEILDLWKRDIVAMIRHLLTDPRFIPHTRYAPEKHYDSKTRQNRVYDEMWSAKWWWQIQNLLGKYATVVPIILSTDKTKLTVFSGNQKAWPVYMTIGNISRNIRRCPSERATLLIGYIPVSNLSNISNATERSETGWQLFHACMESILEPLKTLSRTGIDVLCADGGVRRVFPILAAYIADFPEQAMITCVRESCCPICWIPGDERGDLSVRYPRRDRCQTLDALDDHWNGYTHTIEVLGIRPTRPFWADLPYVDISTCIAPDLLHQLDKGVFGDHTIKWATAMLTAKEMDRRTKGMPRFQKLRHFARGISVISQWTGKEAKALGRTMMAIVAGHEKPKFVQAVRSIMDFSARAHKHEVTESDLQAMDQDIFDFNCAKDVFIKRTKRKSKLVKNEKGFNKIAKLHMLTHYTYLIRQLGAPEGYNTEITERLHIDFVKKPWATTNHVNPTQQMIAHLENREAWALLRAYMHDAGLVLDSRFIEARVDDGEDSDGEPEDSVGGGDGRGDNEVWQPCPTVRIAKRPSLGRSVKGAYLINEHNAKDLVPATIEYLRSVDPARTAFPISHNTTFKVWRRCKLQHRRLPFDPALDPQIDQVRAFKLSTDPEGRVLRLGFFDTVLFSPGANNDNRRGLQGLEAGRVRAIFELPNHHHSLSTKKLVYLERFSRNFDMQALPHLFAPCNITSLSYPEQSPPFATDLALPSGQSQYSMTPSYSRPLHDFDVSFAGPSSTSMSRVPLNSGPVIVPRFDSSHGHLANNSTEGHTCRRMTIHADGVTSPGSPYSVNSSNSNNLHSSAHGSSLVHRHASGYETRLNTVGTSPLDVHRKRIVESEQRRRNDLRGGFARLKDALPASRDKCSKVDLLDRATTYIGHLEATLRDIRGEMSTVKADRFAQHAKPAFITWYIFWLCLLMLAGFGARHVTWPAVDGNHFRSSYYNTLPQRRDSQARYSSAARLRETLGPRLLRRGVRAGSASTRLFEPLVLGRKSP